MRIFLGFIVGLLLSPVAVFAAVTSWDYTSPILQPLYSQRAAEIKVTNITSTSTTAENTFPRLNFTSATGTNATTTNIFATNASTTNLSIGSLRDSVSSLGSSGNILTTTGSLATWSSTSTLAYLSSLNGLTASHQIFATSTAVGGFGFTSSGATHTLRIPVASATTVHGLLSASDWSTFNSKQATVSAGANISITGGTVINSLSLATSSVSTCALLSGVMTGVTGTCGSFVLSASPTLTGITTMANGSSTNFSSGYLAVGQTATTSITTAGVLRTPQIGIGTTSPSSLLTIQGAGLTNPQIGIYNATAGSQGWGIWNQGGNFYIASTSPVTLATSSAQNAFSIVNASFGARVGVNIGAPRATLDLYEQNGSGASPSILMGGNGSGDTDYWLGRISDNGTDNDDSFRIGTGTSPGSNQIVTIDYRGNVGIGSTTPVSIFSVQGTSTNSFPLLTVASTSLNPLLQVLPTGTTTISGGQAATSSVYIYSTAASKGGSIIIEDSAGGACTQINTAAGVVTGKVVTCPTEI